MISNAVRFLPTVPVFASMMLVAGIAQPVRSAHAAPVRAWEESGEASWYGGRHNGRMTSSGTIFNDQELTAAHATLPLGTKVRVTVQDSGQSVVVTITDRQPPKRVRVIDLSRGAASRVGILGRGTAMVALQPVRPGEAIEVAEAPDSATGFQPVGDDEQQSFTDGAPRRHGRLHTRHGGRAVAAARPCCRTPSVIQVRRSAQRPTAPHRL